MSSIDAPNRSKRSPRVTIAVVAIVALVLVLAASGLYLNTVRAAGVAPTQATGAFTGSIEYYLQAPLVIPGAGQSINTHADFFVFTGSQSGDSTILLQPEVSTAGIIHASFIGPFAGTVGDSAPGSFTQIGTFDVNASGPVWQLHATYSVGEGVDGLAGICGGGTFSGTSVGAIPASGLVSFSMTYNATYMFGAKCP
jgi:hypothetical protein